jgi:hypothetical protein
MLWSAKTDGRGEKEERETRKEEKNEGDVYGVGDCEVF